MVEDSVLLGYDALSLGGWLPVFGQNMVPRSSYVLRSKKNARAGRRLNIIYSVSGLWPVEILASQSKEELVGQQGSVGGMNLVALALERVILPEHCGLIKK